MNERRTNREWKRQRKKYNCLLEKQHYPFRVPFAVTHFAVALGFYNDFLVLASQFARKHQIQGNYSAGTCSPTSVYNKCKFFQSVSHQFTLFVFGVHLPRHNLRLQIPEIVPHRIADENFRWFDRSAATILSFVVRIFRFLCVCLLNVVTKFMWPRHLRKRKYSTEVTSTE